MRPRNFSTNSEFLRNDTYNSIKDQLEMQNQALLRQRNQIHKNLNQKKAKGKRHKQSHHSKPSVVSEQNEIIHDQAHPRTISNFGDNGNVSDRIRKKIYQVIKLCQADHNSGSSEFRQIVDAEKQILNYLEQHPSPTKSQKSSKLTPSKMQKVGTNKKSIRQQISNNGFKHLITDDAMEMIEQIQRKTLIEIQSLRMDKIMLMKQLNQQVKGHNQEKRKRIALQKQIKELQRLLSQSGNRHNGTKHPVKSDPYLKNTNGSKYQSNEQIEQQAEEFDEEDIEEQEEDDDDDYNNSQEQEYQQNGYFKNNYPTQINNVQSHMSNNQQNRSQPSINTGTPKNISKQSIPKMSSKHQAPPSHFREAQSTGGFAPEHQAHEQLIRLENQNKRIKHSIQNLAMSPNSGPQNIYNPLKVQLKNELADLQHRIRQYQEALHGHSSNQQNGGNQLQMLLRQGENLTSSGQKLLRVRSKPQFHNQQYNQEIAFLRERIQNLKHQNETIATTSHRNVNELSSPMAYLNKTGSPYTQSAANKNGSARGAHNYKSVGNGGVSSSYSYSKSQTPKARLNTHNYQSILQEMRKVTGI